MRPLAVAQGNRRRANVSTGAVKTGMVGVLASATIAAPIAAAYADTPSVDADLAAAPVEAAARIEPAPVALPSVAEVRDDADAASRAEAREKAPASVGDPSANAPAVESSVDGIAEGDTSIVVTSGAIQPVNGPITSGFGYRIHPVLGYSKMHNGVDYGASCGTPVKAAKSGVVTEAQYVGASGQRVKIEHDNGEVTGYFHLQGYNVSAGQTVSAGDVVGFVGNTGRSTGCHLHFEVQDASGQYYNPLNLFQ